MLEELKEQVVRVAKAADKLGMCKHKSGNFSAFDPQSGCVLVTPSGVARECLKAEDICVVDLDGKVVEWNKVNKPSSETMMHIFTYRERKDVRAIVHTHARFSTAFAILNKPVPPIVYEFAYISKCTTIPVAPYGRPGTVDLAKKVAKTLRNADCCLMQSHGAIAIGKNLDDAFIKAQYVEEISELYYITLAAQNGKEPPTLPEEELEKWAYPKEIKF